MSRAVDRHPNEFDHGSRVVEQVVAAASTTLQRPKTGSVQSRAVGLSTGTAQKTSGEEEAGDRGPEHPEKLGRPLLRAVSWCSVWRPVAGLTVISILSLP